MERLRGKIVVLENQVMAAAEGLENVRAVSHMCDDCSSYETANRTLYMLQPLPNAQSDQEGIEG